MKKIFTLMVAAIGFVTIASAQQGNRSDMYGRSDRFQSVETRGGNSGYDRNTSNSSSYNNNWGQNNRYDSRMSDRDRRANIDRINRDYDQRIYGYRNDRSINSYERDRRIRQAEYERSQKVNSFVKGMVVGALATVILGAILSH